MRLLWVGVTVVELRYALRPKHGTKFLETTWLLRNGHRHHSFPLLTQFRPFRHMTQPIKVYIGTGGNCHQCLAANPIALSISLSTRDGECASRLQNGAGIFKHVLNSCTDGVRVHQDDLIDPLATQAKGFFTHLLYRHTLRK